jgi:hypothetical protein
MEALALGLKNNYPKNLCINLIFFMVNAIKSNKYVYIQMPHKIIF